MGKSDKVKFVPFTNGTAIAATLNALLHGVSLAHIEHHLRVWQEQNPEFKKGVLKISFCGFPGGALQEESLLTREACENFTMYLLAGGNPNMENIQENCAKLVKVIHKTYQRAVEMGVTV